jgi:hypothetical protein
MMLAANTATLAVSNAIDTATRRKVLFLRNTWLFSLGFLNSCSMLLILYGVNGVQCAAGTPEHQGIAHGLCLSRHRVFLQRKAV